MVNRCKFFNNGSQCDATVHVAGRASVEGADMTCRGCIRTNWGKKLEQAEGTKLRLRNIHYEGDIANLSHHQELLQRVTAILEKKDVDINEEDIEAHLLKYLRQEYWEVDSTSLVKGKRIALPMILYFKQQQTLSVEDTVTAIIMLECKNQKHKEGMKKASKQRILSGADKETCHSHSCIGKGKWHVASWSQLRSDYEFLCSGCMSTELIQLSKTNADLSFLPVGPNGIIMFKNPYYDPSSEDLFCCEEVIFLDLNLGKFQPHVALMLIAAGVVPSVNDTAHMRNEFLKKVRQMTKEYEDNCEKKRSHKRMERASLHKKQKQILAKIGEEQLSLSPQVIDTRVQEMNVNVLDCLLPQSSKNDPFFASCCATSMEAEEDSNGNISYSVVKNEHLAKWTFMERTILLTPKGGPLVKDVDFEVYYSVEEFNQANPNDGKISVLVYCLVEGVDHETVRIVEEKGINSIQGKAKEFLGQIISTEDSENYRRGQLSEKYFAGGGFVVVVKGWYKLVLNGKLFLSANIPLAQKKNVFGGMASLQDASYWKLVGDKEFTLKDRLSMMVMDMPTTTDTSMHKALIAAQPTLSQQRKANTLSQLTKLNQGGGVKKQQTKPSEFGAKTHVLVSGTGVDRYWLDATLKANNWGLKRVNEFPDDIGQRKDQYVFVAGAGATERKHKIAKDHGIDIWTPSHLSQVVGLVSPMFASLNQGGTEASSSRKDSSGYTSSVKSSKMQGTPSSVKTNQGGVGRGGLVSPMFASLNQGGTEASSSRKDSSGYTSSVKSSKMQGTPSSAKTNQGGVGGGSLYAKLKWSDSNRQTKVETDSEQSKKKAKTTQSTTQSTTLDRFGFGKK